ncbi:MAG: flagellar motor protein MotB, partial [Candidatus Aminicenantes bacterium]|nr:flagellar motor protein MotB [Candidatus Aminicenantes bacterium]
MQVGDAVTLTWNVPDADEVYLTGVGLVASRGRLKVTPTQVTTIYTLIAETQPRITTAEVFVEVTGSKGETFP